VQRLQIGKVEDVELAGSFGKNLHAFSDGSVLIRHVTALGEGRYSTSEQFFPGDSIDEIRFLEGSLLNLYTHKVSIKFNGYKSNKSETFTPSSATANEIASFVECVDKKLKADGSGR
jgi:hypothetical protein